MDNLNGFVLLNRTLRVDHVKNYRREKVDEEDEQAMLAHKEREHRKVMALKTGQGCKP